MSCIKRERVVRPPSLPHSCSAMYFANAEAMSTTIVIKSQTYQPIIKIIQVPQYFLAKPQRTQSNGNTACFANLSLGELSGLARDCNDFLPW